MRSMRFLKSRLLGNRGRQISRVLNLLIVVSLVLVLTPAPGVEATTLTAPTSANTDGQTVGTPWTGEAPVTETTSQIMARTPALNVAQVRPQKPFLRPNRQNLKQNPNSPAVADFPTPSGPQPAPRGAGPYVAQTTGTEFTGATLADTGAFPPDTMGTVGPSQFIVAVNGRLRSFNKTTGVADAVLNTDMDVFFTSVMTPPVANNFTSDPKIRYDRVAKRWYVIIIDVPGGAGALPNRVLLAVSDAASNGIISGATVWSFYFFQFDTVSPAGDTGNFFDYPTLGVDGNALYIGGNVFTPTTFSNTTAFVVRKSSILSGGPIVVTAFRGLLNGSFVGPYTPQGVDNFDPAATEGYFVGVDGAAFGLLQIRRITNPGGTPAISGNLSVTVPSTALPKTVPHQGNTGGTNGQLDALDDRPYMAVARNGSLWTAHNINVNSGGVGSGAGDRNGSRWYQISNLTTTPTLTQSGTVFDGAAANPLFYWIPSIMISGQGHVAMGFSAAGNTLFASAATVGRLSGDASGTMQTPPTIYETGAAAYNPPNDPGGASGRRWGDYSYTSLDPEDDMTMWTIQEFTSSANVYGVRAVKLIAPPPATPTSASPSPLLPGQSSVNVTITGNSISGSGFYDPGNGFSKRLTATVNGGVTVNSVTYNSPTSVTLNISTIGATLGTHDVTITNPDGQTLTGANILTVNTVACANPLAVVNNLDDTSCGSLRLAVATANSNPALPTSGKIVDLSGLIGPNKTITLSAAQGGGLTVNAGVTIMTNAVCPAGGPDIIIQAGAGITGDGLTLNGATLKGVWVKGFGGRQIFAHLVSSTTPNLLSCVKATKT